MNNENKINTGLWTQTSKNGLKYASGKVKLGDKEYRITLFSNKNKKTEKSPDFTLIFEENNQSETTITKKDPYKEFGDLIEHKSSIKAEEVDQLQIPDAELPF